MQTTSGLQVIRAESNALIPCTGPGAADIKQPTEESFLSRYRSFFVLSKTVLAISDERIGAVFEQDFYRSRI